MGGQIPPKTARKTPQIYGIFASIRPVFPICPFHPILTLHRIVKNISTMGYATWGSDCPKNSRGSCLGDLTCQFWRDQKNIREAMLVMGMGFNSKH
jgi:hypothetical protein